MYIHRDTQSGPDPAEAQVATKELPRVARPPNQKPPPPQPPPLTLKRAQSLRSSTTRPIVSTMSPLSISAAATQPAVVARASRPTGTAPRRVVSAAPRRCTPSRASRSAVHVAASYGQTYNPRADESPEQAAARRRAESERVMSRSQVSWPTLTLASSNLWRSPTGTSPPPSTDGASDTAVPTALALEL